MLVSIVMARVILAIKELIFVIMIYSGAMEDLVSSPWQLLSMGDASQILTFVRMEVTFSFSMS